MKFIDPRTDFAFKKIFASESSKPILISFLNALIYQGNPIGELVAGNGRSIVKNQSAPCVSCL